LSILLSLFYLLLSLRRLNPLKAQDFNLLILDNPGLIPVLEAPRPLPPYTILELPLLCLSAVESLGHGLNVSVDNLLIRLSKLLPSLTDNSRRTQAPL